MFTTMFLRTVDATMCKGHSMLSVAFAYSKTYKRNYKLS